MSDVRTTDPVAQAIEDLTASQMANLEKLGNKIRELRAEKERQVDEIDRLRNLLTIATEDYEGTNGRMLVGNHWSIRAREELNL